MFPVPCSCADPCSFLLVPLFTDQNSSCTLFLPRHCPQSLKSLLLWHARGRLLAAGCWPLFLGPSAWPDATFPALGFCVSLSSAWSIERYTGLRTPFPEASSLLYHPPLSSASLSGENQVTHAYADGPQLSKMWLWAPAVSLSSAPVPVVLLYL